MTEKIYIATVTILMREEDGRDRENGDAIQRVFTKSKTYDLKSSDTVEDLFSRIQKDNSPRNPRGPSQIEIINITLNETRR
ncbi:hypothetical protein [Rhizobium sp. FY34]|uniref:hypothetical protein n=1 Tax=Rhizobium sp. FY34 TaxID=2562309 RepID=UPI0010C0B259|nr:hypothetical protein [Rhizobium sp. FY34]